MAAVVFDMDGVLLDSEQVWDDVRRALAAEHGRAWDPGATAAMMGMSTPEWSTYLVESLGLPLKPAEVARTVIDRVADVYGRHPPMQPGAPDAVVRVAARWPLAIASSSPVSLIDTVLAATGLARYFDARVSSEQVAAGKPAPDVYLAAVRGLRAQPRRCAAIEDSSNGIRSAAAAGLMVVAVPNPHFPPRPDALALAAATVADLHAVDQALIAGLPARRTGRDLRPGPSPGPR